MPFSHHSHSGQFCDHATDPLEKVIQAAIAKGMRTFCLTEHMPHDLEDFYPGERDRYPDAAALVALFSDYYAEAVRLRHIYGSQINLPIGFESEWIRPSTLGLVRGIQQKFQFDVFVGSVHHVHTIPIDFDRPMYEEAREIAGGTDEKLFERYFDEHLDMLTQLQPPVVGHFDLIRLLSDTPDVNMSSMPGVWSRALRNLDFVAAYGGKLEVNTAALRKGLKEPYPSVQICKEFVQRGGSFVLSDDSHGVAHIGTNYDRVLPFLEQAGITHLYALEAVDGANGIAGTGPARFDFTAVELSEVRTMCYWQ